MPSIPQSLLWISLVVLWLFVLVPMLISKRDAVRRTSDVALATRVLNSGTSARLLRRGGPAAGHRSDPHWKPSEQDHDEDLDAAVEEEEAPAQKAAVVLAAPAAPAADAEPDYLDVDIVEEDSGALPVGASAAQTIEQADDVPVEEPDEFEDEDTDPAMDLGAIEDAADVDEVDEVDHAEADDEDEAEYEYVDDSSGLEAPSEADLKLADSMSASRRRRHESATAAAVTARKYRFRKRMLTSLGVAVAGTALAAFLVAPWAWWLCATAGTVTVLYLGYLRRQTRIEEQLRRRRAQRMARSRLGVENTGDREFDVMPSRLRRPGAAVLEIDDEDPIFEHLEYARMVHHYDLPRAVGQ